MLRPIRHGASFHRVEELLEEQQLNTVCVGAKCPNRGECYAAGTATFMIMGDCCTRDCGFCAVAGGIPGPLDAGEPARVAKTANAMGLSHVVVTSVTRDDVPDGGAAHFANVVEAVRETMPDVTVEVLVPDFQGSPEAIEKVLEAKPEVFNHNMETVRRLYGKVRPQADYIRSLYVLGCAAEAGLAVKSGFMVGLGESQAEVDELLGDLLDAGCSLVTAGQYLRPAEANAPVKRYWDPEEFEALRETALEMGFRAAAAGPLVRSSYFAHEMLENAGLAPVSE
jgi:lipoic acid synthetase